MAYDTKNVLKLDSKIDQKRHGLSNKKEPVTFSEETKKILERVKLERSLTNKGKRMKGFIPAKFGNKKDFFRTIGL